MLALARAGAGLPGKPLRGHYKHEGNPVNVHWGGGGAVPRDPDVNVTNADGTVDIRVGGTEEQVRNVWRGLRKKYGSVIPTIEEALANATRTSEPSPWVEMNLVNQLPNMHRLAAKVALSGGSAIWGDDFGDTELAARLREILAAQDGCFTPDQRMCQFEYLAVVTEAAMKVTPVELPDIVVPSQGPGVVPTSQVAFGPVPAGQASTAIFVNILNFPTPPYGILLPGHVPGKPTMAVVLRENRGAKAVTWRLDEIFFSAFASIAERPGLDP